MELINHFVGLTFGWAMLGLLLLPFWVMFEVGLLKYVKYSTVGEVSFTTPLYKLWRKYLSPFYYGWEGGGSWLYNKNYEPLAVITWGIWVGVVVIGSIANYVDHGAAVKDTIILLSFSIFVTAGVFLAPLLAALSAMFGISFLSRKVFGLKQTLAKHMVDKKAHE